MTNANIILSTTPAELQNQWCVYELYDGNTAVVVYIGVCKLSNLFSIPDARSNVLFDETFDEAQSLLIRLLKQCQTKVEAQRHVIQFINERGTPLMNCATFQHVNQRIRCVTTGETFKSAKEACDAHDLVPSQLSNHLSKKPSYRTCKGKIYKRINVNEK